jgi:hypothetical protein
MSPADAASAAELSVSPASGEQSRMLIPMSHVYKGEGGYAEDDEFFESMADI